MRVWAIVLLGTSVVVGASLLSAGCKSSSWLEGKWLLVTEEGKPASCYEFHGDGRYSVFVGTRCSGEVDRVLSGKWQLKEDNRLAVQQAGEAKAAIAIIATRSAERLVVRGAIAGTFHRLAEGGAEALVRTLEQTGGIRLRRMPDELGCQQLAQSLERLRALPKELEPRMIRQRDQALDFRQRRASGSKEVEKEVYALDHESVEWLALHLAEPAFAGEGPLARFEEQLGRPQDTATTGAGETRQQIVMWKSYCGNLRGALNKDVDVTLVLTPGQRRGTVYVSEGVLSGIWEDLKHITRAGSGGTGAE